MTPHRTATAWFAILSLIVLSNTITGCSRRVSEPGFGVRESDVSGGPATPLLQREIVRRGRMHVEVDDLAAARRRLEDALAALGGRVELAEVTADERASYTLRVPANRLDAMMDSTAALGEVQSRTVSARDVTDQVVDTEARLAALRATRDRLRELLARASSVADVVSVERELARVQGELDSLEGRLQALRGEVALSELVVQLDRKQVLGPLGWLLRGAATVIEKLFVWR